MNDLSQNRAVEAADNQPAWDDLAQLYKASGDPLRLEILRVLAKDAFGVQELCALFDIRQPAMSHHLKVLSAAGLVEAQREGNSIFYRRATLGHALLGAAIQPLYQEIDRLEPRDSVMTNLKQVRQQRAEQSLAFFARHAKDFRDEQEKVAEFQLYAKQLQSLIERLGLGNGQTALEIGPGDGRFLEVLSEQFTQVIALDNSEAMLEQARAHCHAKGLKNLTFIHGDTREGVEQGLRAELLVMNMVLHHVPSPASVLADCAEMLEPGGSILISELCHHDQQWTREACGDLWLGFDSEELSHWAEQSQLQAGESLYLGVRNGFQVQIRHFFKPETSAAAPENPPILVPLTQPPHTA